MTISLITQLPHGEPRVLIEYPDDENGKHCALARVQEMSASLLDLDSALMFTPADLLAYGTTKEGEAVYAYRNWPGTSTGEQARCLG